MPKPARLPHKPTTVSLPLYLLDDSQLEYLIQAIANVKANAAEDGLSCPELDPSIAAAFTEELLRRGATIKLTPQGTFDSILPPIH